MTWENRPGVEYRVPGPGGAVLVVTDPEAVERHLPELEVRPHPWRRQPSIRGRRLTVRQAVGWMAANRMSLDDAANDMDISTEELGQAVWFYEHNREMVDLETAHENRLLREKFG